MITITCMVSYSRSEAERIIICTNASFASLTRVCTVWRSHPSRAEQLVACKATLPKEVCRYYTFQDMDGLVRIQNIHHLQDVCNKHFSVQHRHKIRTAILGQDAIEELVNMVKAFNGDDGEEPPEKRSKTNVEVCVCCQINATSVLYQCGCQVMCGSCADIWTGKCPWCNAEPGVKITILE